jgi:hypothetical protein
VLVVGVNTHLLADVVQQGAVLQQLAVTGVEPVHGLRLVEQLNRQPGDLSTVDLVPPPPPGEVEHRHPTRLAAARHLHRRGL